MPKSESVTSGEWWWWWSGDQWFFHRVVVDEAAALVKLAMNDIAEAASPKITTTNEMNGYAQMNQNSEMVKICGFGPKIQIWTWRRLR